MLQRLGWSNLTVATLAEMSRSGLNDYSRGGRGGKRQAIHATRERAAKIAQTLRCNFSQLWSEV